MNKFKGAKVKEGLLISINDEKIVNLEVTDFMVYDSIKKMIYTNEISTYGFNVIISGINLKLKDHLYVIDKVTVKTIKNVSDKGTIDKQSDNISPLILHDAMKNQIK